MGNEQLPELPPLSNFSQPHLDRPQAPTQAPLNTTMNMGATPGFIPTEAPQQPSTKKKTSIGLIATIIVAVTVLAIATPIGLFVYFNSQPKFLLDSRNEVASVTITSPSVRGDSCITDGTAAPTSYFGTEAAAMSGTFATDLEATEKLADSLYGPATNEVLTKLEPYAIEASSEGGATETVQFALYRLDTIESSTFIAVRSFDASRQTVTFTYSCTGTEDVNYADFISALESANVSVFTGE